MKNWKKALIYAMSVVIMAALLAPSAVSYAAEKLDVFEINDNKGRYVDPEDETGRDADYVFKMDGNDTELTLNAVTEIYADLDAVIQVTWTAVDIGYGVPTITPYQNGKYATITTDKNKLVSRKRFRIKVDATSSIQVETVDENGETKTETVQYQDSRIIEIIQDIATASFLRVDFAPGNGPVFRDMFGGVTFTVSMQDINGEDLSGPINWILSDSVDFWMDADTNTLYLTNVGKEKIRDSEEIELYTTVQASIHGVSESKIFEILFQPDDETEEKIKITFNSNVTGANVVPGFPSKLTVVGRKYGFLPKVERTGYTFMGWFTEALGGRKIESSTRVPAGSKDHTLYAHWIMNGSSPSLTKVNTATGDFRVVAEGNETPSDGIFRLTAVKYGHGNARLLKLSGTIMSRTVIPAGIRASSSEFTVDQIAKNALAGKTRIKTLVIPSTIKKIGAGAFKNMKGLTRIEIDAFSLKSVGKNAFKGIPGGTQVLIRADTAAKYRRAVKLISARGGANLSFRYAD